MTKAESSKASSKPDAKLQTITLKVFVHCEGCRRKIRRIIRVLDGVEDVTVDSPTGKVTVTGVGIDPKIVIQRLQKHGKHAELWPGAKAGPSAVTESAGGNQPKPAASNSPPGPDKKKENGADKKKENGGGEMGGTKPAATPGKNEGKKGGGKKAEETPVADGKKGGGTSELKQGSSESKDTEKSVSEDSKPTNAASKGEASAAAPPQENGGGGGKKGKKGGNGQSNGSDGGGDGGSCGGGAADHPPRSLPPPPPRHIQDVPIAGLPATSTVMVSANRGPAPYDYIHTGYSESSPVEYATNMFSDENANNCSIM